MKFIRKVVHLTVQKVKSLARSFKDHTEAITILSLSAVGANVMLGEVPFMWTTPMWLEAPMLIPVVSILLVSLLVRNAERRSTKRRVRAIKVRI